MTAPGICVEWLASFLEVALCHYFIRIFSADQFPKKKQRILFFILASMITTGGILLNLVELSFSMATVLFFCAANVIAACILYKGNAADFAVITLLFITSLNILDWCLLEGVARIWSAEAVLDIQSGFSLLRIGIVGVIKPIEAAVYLLLGKLLKKAVLRIKKRRLVQFGAAAAFVSSFFLFCTSGIYPDLNLNPFQTVLAAAIIAGLCLFYLLYRLKRMENEQIFTARQNLLLQKNYELAQAAYQANAQLYHDMRNHFLLLQNYLAEGKIAQAQVYLEKLSGSKAVGGGEHWTGIEAIDYILGQKIAGAGKRQIAVTINAEYPKDCRIEPVDLCSIITNLLDNAIEGAEKCPEYMEKKIDIVIRRIHQFILIRITNSTASAPLRRGGRLVTTKKDKQMHGWGMKSVISAAEKYNGTVEYGYADFMFSVSVMLFY